MTRSRTPAFRMWLMSWTIRPRLTRAMRTPQLAIRRLAAFCTCARGRPRGVQVGMRMSMWLNEHARKLRSCSRRRPAGRGDGVTSASRFSWVLPTEGCLRKRIVSASVRRGTLLTVWHFFCSREQRVCAVGGCRHGATWDDRAESQWHVPRRHCCGRATACGETPCRRSVGLS
jgi:hypothetical protein